MTNDSRLREVALIIADDLIGICETATKVAHRTGNTFVIDRQRTASMIQGRIASLNKSNLNERCAKVALGEWKLGEIDIDNLHGSKLREWEIRKEIWSAIRSLTTPPASTETTK